MRIKFFLISCITLALTASACGNAGEGDADGTSAPSEQAAMALNVDINGDTDVAGFRFEVRRVDCSTGDPYTPAETYHADESLEEAQISGDRFTFDGTSPDSSYDEASGHLFSDHLFTVVAGCYDLKATPIDDDGNVSEDCAVAQERNQRAEAGTSNEFHLISQCRGDALTTLDVAASLNHPPTVELDIQKFACAGAGVRVCATASDPDGDPLRFRWEGASEGCLAIWPEGRPVRDEETGEVTQCAIIPTDIAESHEYRVTIKDMAWNAELCQLEPIEHVLDRQAGEPGMQSRAELYFPVHALGECIPPSTAFIGVTLGGNLGGPHHDQPDTTRGMSKTQARKLAANAVSYVNPNLLGDADPHMLVVHDRSHEEDKHEADYIAKLLALEGFTDVDQLTVSPGGLQYAQTVGYKIIWYVNPGWPVSDSDSVQTLTWFRNSGGGVILSGDDSNQTESGIVPDDMRAFSGLDYLDDNGTNACGQHTDNNAGHNYKVHFAASSPLAADMSDLTFPYGNDIDGCAQLHGGEQLGASTSGLTSDAGCLGASRPVMTTIPSPVTIP